MALGNLVAQAVSSTNLRKILQTRYALVEEVAPLTAESWMRGSKFLTGLGIFTASSLASESWMRGSKFPEICPREEVLVSVAKLTRKREINPDFYLTLEIGKALHHQLQNSILPGAGVLMGEWECCRCGAHYGIMKRDKPIEQYAVKRPDQCSRCEQTDAGFRFHEYSFRNEEYRIEGHPDGVLCIPGMNGLGLLEAKSISAKGAWEIRNVPKMDHVIQSHIYMWFTGLTWTKIVYWDKATFGMSALVEHTVERDEETIDRIKGTLLTLWKGIESGVAPATRVCANAEAPRAKDCVVCQPCFESPAEEPNDGE